MMATTHVFTGLAIAAPVAVLVPEFAPFVALGAILGGLFPDFDLYVGHRKTLHFPVYYSACAFVTAVIAVAAPTALTLGIALFFAAAAAHSVVDVFGGGLERKPWRGTSSRAVYDHYHGRWIAPRRWIRYDGAPEDFFLGVFLALPALAVFDGIVRTLVLALLSVSLVYTAVRKPLVDLAEYLIDRLPAELVDYLPQRLVPVDGERSNRSASTELAGDRIR